MEEARPKIFISAISKELASARGNIADVLRLLQFQPVCQQEFPNHTGNIRDMLDAELAPCAAVIQIVGNRYGGHVHEAATSAPFRFAYSTPLP
jgi:hypothetical protein